MEQNNFDNTIKTKTSCKYCGSTEIIIDFNEPERPNFWICCNECGCVIPAIDEKELLELIKREAKKQWEIIMTLSTEKNNCPFCNQQWEIPDKIKIYNDGVEAWIQCMNCSGISPSITLTEKEILELKDDQSSEEKLTKKIKKIWRDCNFKKDS